MTTQIERARAGEVTPEMAQVARDEGLSPQLIRERVARGTIVIPNNTNRRHRAVGIGEGLRTKVDASIGTSSDIVDVRAEIGREMGCQMMIEGPGHVPLDEIEGDIQLEKRRSGNAPYYVRGPLPCDVGAVSSS